MEYSLYVHIPFCRSRCRYCDFYSTVACIEGDIPAVPEAYIDALIRDFYRFAPNVDATPAEAAGGTRRQLPARPTTVYFGGGTPGLLLPTQVERLLQTFAPAPGAEVTLEANPEGLDAKRLVGWLRAGINRLSLGVQSASEESLQRLGRRHSAADAARAFALARTAGFENLSGDIMLALPGYSNAEFDQTLALLATGGATHVSAYMLKLEPGTPMGDLPPDGLPDADESAAHYTHAVGQLAAAGYYRYEISNFAKPGFASRHNLLYWDAASWLGLGPGAHSCMAGRRFSFAPDLDAYLADSARPVPEGEMTPDDYMMLRLRLDEGLDEEALHCRFGTGLRPGQRALFAQLQAAGLARRTPGGWALTTAGMLVQNAVLERLFAV